MVIEFFRGGPSNELDEVEASIVGMLRDGNDVFMTATNALFGGGKSKETKEEVRTTDMGINEAEKSVRRSLLIHAAVNQAELPLVLQYASIVKDAERVGDYSKNMYDLVKYGANFDGAPDQEDLERYRDKVGRLILDAADVFGAKNASAAQRLLGKADAFLDEYDAQVRAAYKSKGETSDAVARALYFRFLKRTTAHVMNVLTSLVQPLDRLDYYDEAKEDR
ncbi:MAG: phosphate signaling complex protein PhoU [Acidimicrobiia bacterium]|nr:MAG: phosphate signaling complex protein PhoU [Acidimicrobiia bacterium]